METRKISELKLWEDNPRSINEKDYQRLKDQVTLLGSYKPLLITDNNIVIGGNMRLRVLRDLGINEVWVSVIEFVQDQGFWYAVVNGERQKKPFESALYGMTEYALSDNDQAGYNDEGMLANLLGRVNIDLSAYSVNLKPQPTISEILKELSEKPKKYSVIIECANEEEKNNTSGRLRELGYKIKK